MRFLKLVVLFCSLTMPVFALTFSPNTEFLDAQDQYECEKLGGTFTVWYDEYYCTRELSNNMSQINGKTVREAQQLFPKRIFRVVEIDGKPQIVTKDYIIGRINVALQNQLIVSYEIEGAKISAKKSLPKDLPYHDKKGAKLAKCSVSLEGKLVYQDYCYFLPEGGNGGFSIYPPHDDYFHEKIAIISLWKTSKTGGDVRALVIDDIAINSRWGAVTRSTKKPACWVSDAKYPNDQTPEFEICVHAVK